VDFVSTKVGARRKKQTRVEKRRAKVLKGREEVGEKWCAVDSGETRRWLKLREE
jgi:hypothetical protein